MAYNEHVVVKPEKLAAVAAESLERNLVVPATFRREGIDQFKGAAGDAVNVRVEGVLPYRTYGWRNDRSTDVQFDEYAEKTVQVTFGDDIYSGVRLTDEQYDFDEISWAKFLQKQTDAIGRGLEYKATQKLLGQTYECTVGGAKTTTDANGTFVNALFRARMYLNKMAPSLAGDRFVLVSPQWEYNLLQSAAFKADNIGQSSAENALRNNSIGRLAGFDIVVAPELPDDWAVAMIDSAFIFASGAPTVPQSVEFGASASARGVGVRWMRQYNLLKKYDQSLVDTWHGFREVKDDIIFQDPNTHQPRKSNTQHFVRALKLSASATSDTTPTGDLGFAAGFTTTDPGNAWEESSSSSS